MQTDIERWDWNAAWQSALAARGFRPRDKDFWNRQAESYVSHANHKSDYPRQFLNIIRPQSSWRVLDVGCGPGTIAIPLAPMVAHITALDFSERMLSLLHKSCSEKKITHIRPVQADWEDAWEGLGIEPHDVVIASRSFVPADLDKAIQKINRFATRQVCISAIVGTGPFDRRIMAAAGRSFKAGPDYIYILNQLHSMGIYARLDFTFHPVNRTYVDHHDAVDECRWMMPDMTAEEKERLLHFFKENLVFKKDRWFLPGTPPMRWAVICWEPPQGRIDEKDPYGN